MKHKSFRIRSEKRTAALAIFRAWRKRVGLRQAYWLAVSRFGCPFYSSLAWAFMDRLTRQLAAAA